MILTGQTAKSFFNVLRARFTSKCTEDRVIISFSGRLHSSMKVYVKLTGSRPFANRRPGLWEV